MSKLLDEIRKAIETGDKTRYRLASETYIDQAQLSRLMSGDCGLGYDNLERLAAALGYRIALIPVGQRTEPTRQGPRNGKVDSKAVRKGGKA